jgi:predicted dehydrogenase
VSGRATGSIGWGILATGGIARRFTQELLDHGHRVAAVGSRSPESARRFAAQLAVPKACSSYEELVADPGVDVVYVATPHSLHAQNALLALEAGKHVLVEKPFTLNAAQARTVVDSARSRGLLVMEAMWTRFLPHMAFIRSMVADGRIGEVRWLQADHLQQLSSDPRHRLNDPALGGGALLDLGVYPLSFAHDILGPPSEVTARATLGGTGVEVAVATTLRHAGDAMSTSYSSIETWGPNTATIVGTEGRIEVDPVWYRPTAVTVKKGRGEVVERFDRPVSGHGMYYQATEVEGLIERGETASRLMPPEESEAVMRTLDAVRSAIGVRFPQER